MGPIGRGQADELARFLARYAIETAGLTVKYELRDGRMVTDHGMADIIKRQAGMYAGGLGGGGVVAAPVASATAATATAMGCMPMLVALAAAAMPYLLALQGALMVASPILDRQNQKRLGHPETVYTHVFFDLAGVSARRRRWSEFLLSVYAARQTWQLSGLVYADQLAAGARYAATHPNPNDPPPWGERERCTRVNGSASTSARTASGRGRRWPGLRDLW